MTAKFKKATHGQLIEVADIFKRVIERLPDGRCQYSPGNNDATVAEAAGCPISTVANLRIELYGTLQARKGEGQSSPVAKELEELQARCDALEARLKVVEELAGCTDSADPYELPEQPVRPHNSRVDRAAAPHPNDDNYPPERTSQIGAPWR